MRIKKIILSLSFLLFSIGFSYGYNSITIETEGGGPRTTVNLPSNVTSELNNYFYKYKTCFNNMKILKKTYSLTNGSSGIFGGLNINDINDVNSLVNCEVDKRTFSNGKFFTKNEGGNYVDSFYNGGFYKLNVGSQNYSFINSFYFFNPTKGNIDFLTKSFLSIDRTYLKSTELDGLLSYLKRNNLKSRYLGYIFVLGKSLNELNLDMKTFNIKLNNFVKNNGNNVINGFNSKLSPETVTLKININGSDVDLHIIPYQKNPYFGYTPTTKSPFLNYKKGGKIIKYAGKNGVNYCGEYTIDENGDGQGNNLNLLDYYSFIYNCGYRSYTKTELLDYSKNKSTFTYHGRINNLDSGVYPITFVSVKNILDGFEDFSDSVLTDGWSINYGFQVLSDNSEDISLNIIDSFSGKFQNDFLKHYKTVEDESNGIKIFNSLLKDYAKSKYVIEQSLDDTNFSSILDKNVKNTIKENLFFGHYRNVKDLDSVSFGNDKLSKILGISSSDGKIITDYIINMFNGRTLFMENLGEDSKGLKMIKEDRKMDIFSETETSLCETQGATTKKNVCVSSLWKNKINSLLKYQKTPIGYKDEGGFGSFKNAPISLSQFKYNYNGSRVNLFNSSFKFNGTDGGFNGGFNNSLGGDLETIYVGKGSYGNNENIGILYSVDEDPKTLGIFGNLHQNYILSGENIEINNNGDIYKFPVNSFGKVKGNISYKTSEGNQFDGGLPFGNYILDGSASYYPTNKIKINGDTIGIYLKDNSNTLYKGNTTNLSNLFGSYGNVGFVSSFLGDNKVRDQNSYGIYQVMTTGYVQKGLSLNLTYGGDHNDRGMLIGLNNPFINYKDLTTPTKSENKLYDFVGVEGKSYKLGYYNGDSFSVKIGGDIETLIDDGNLNSDGYVFSFTGFIAAGKLDVDEDKNETVQKLDLVKFQATSDDVNKNALYYGLLNMYSNIHGFNIDEAEVDGDNKINLEAYYSVFDNSLIQFLVFNDTSGKKWTLINYFKDGKAYYLTKIGFDFLPGVIQDVLNNGSEEDFKINIMETNGKNIILNKIKKVNFNNSLLNELSKVTFTVFETGMYTKKLDTSGDYFIPLTLETTEFKFDEVSYRNLSKKEALSGKMIFQIGEEPEDVNNPYIREYLSDLSFKGTSKIFLGLSDEIGRTDISGEPVSKNKLFNFKASYPRKRFILVFDNKGYNNLPPDEQLLTNVIGNNYNILGGSEVNFIMNSYFTNWINSKAVENNSTDYFDVNYKVNTKILKNKDIKEGIIGPYKLNILTNFKNIAEFKLDVRKDDSLTDGIIDFKLECDGGVIKDGTSEGFHYTGPGFDVIEGLNIKDCYIGLYLNSTEENLEKLTGKTLELTAYGKYKDVDGINKTLEPRKFTFTLNDILFVNSLPYGSIGDIPECQLVTKNKTTVAAGGVDNVIVGGNISGPYEQLEVDVLYKNPDIDSNGNVSKYLKGVTIELNLDGNGKFNNYNYQYLSQLNSIFSSLQLGTYSKELIKEITNNLEFKDNKISIFVPANHFKKSKFFGKTTFTIDPKTNNLEDYKFGVSGSCKYLYDDNSETIKTMDGAINFSYKLQNTQDDYVSVTYYNPESKSLPLYSNGYSKVLVDGKSYLIKQYYPTMFSIGYMHNKALNIEKNPRVKNNRNGSPDGVTDGVENLDEGSDYNFGFHNFNNAPYDGSTLDGYGLLDSIPRVQKVNDTGWVTKGKCGCCGPRCSSPCGSRQDRDMRYDHYNNELHLPTPYDTVYSSIISNSSWLNGREGRIGQAFGGYTRLFFKGSFTFNKKKIGNDAGVVISDRILPICLKDNIQLKYKTKLLNLGNSNLFLVDQGIDLMKEFLTGPLSQGNGCVLSTNEGQIEMVSSSNDDNIFEITEKVLENKDGLPWFLKNNSSKKLPTSLADVQNTQFHGSVQVGKDGLMKIYLPEWFKKEVNNIEMRLKFAPGTTTSDDGKLKIEYEITFDLKYQDKTSPDKVKNNLLYKYLDVGLKGYPLFNIQTPVLSVTSFQESYGLNESKVLNKIMFKGNDTDTKEIVKTSVANNFKIEGKYKKFTVSEYRKGFNNSEVNCRRCTARGDGGCSLGGTDDFYKESEKIHPYFVGINPTIYSLNKSIESNFINTWYQYTDPIGGQINNKTIMINGLPSIKGIGNNQIIFEGLCNVCGSFEGNIWENASVGMYNPKIKNSKQGITNLFKYYTDERNYWIKKTEIEDNFMINAEVKKDFNNLQPFVNLLLVRNTDKVEITPEGVGEMDSILFYEGEKAIYVKGIEGVNEKPVDVVISTDLLPKGYENFEDGKKIDEHLVIVSDGDIIIGSDVSVINAILITKGNIVVMPGNNGLKIHGGIAANGSFINYRTNINDIDTKVFGDNFTKFMTNVPLYNLKYPVNVTIDPRFINSRIFGMIEKVYKDRSN